MKKFCILPALLILGLLAAFIVSPKAEFSENENRYLQGKPELNLESLKSGAFMEDAGDYICDHFPLRDKFMGFNTLFNRYILGKSDINGVYFCKDDYYIEKYNAPENTSELVEKINAFCDKTNAKVYLALAPTAVTIYSDKLPIYAERANQLDTMEEYYYNIKAEPVDLYSSLYENKADKLYYRLDHHWTTLGAYFAYKDICGAMGLEPVSEDNLNLETVTDDFRGTIFSKLDLESLEGESIEIYNPQSELSVYYTDTKETKDSLYNFEYLDKKDKYSLFLDNIHPLIEITNKSVDTGRSLAIVKDSYANCLVPYLAEHFDKIYFFDTRYYRGSVSEFVNENDITDVLILYNLNSIDTDLGIRAVY